MRHLKSYKLFENTENSEMFEYKQIVRDSLSDLTDEGFNVDIYDVEDTFAVRISKPGTEYNRQTYLGFKIEDIMGGIDEMKSQLSLEVKDIYYHIKGYEPATWYSTDIKFKDLPEDPIDQLSIEFEI